LQSPHPPPRPSALPARGTRAPPPPPPGPARPPRSVSPDRRYRSPERPLTTCVLNVITSDVSGTADPATGSTNVSPPLVSRVYLTGNSTSPCPKCSGTCQGGANSGHACTPVGSFGTSIDCTPPPAQFLAQLDVAINPLTTGIATNTAADGNFCSGQATAGEF